MHVRVQVVVGKMDKTWYAEEIELLEPEEDRIVSMALERAEERLRLDERAAKQVAFLAVWHIERIGENDGIQKEGLGQGGGGEGKGG